MTLREEFERAWPWLKAAIIHDTHRKRHVWDAIERGQAQLWANETAALVTEISVFPTGLKAINAWLAGGDLDGVLTLSVAAEAFGRANGCTLATIAAGRRGWARTLDGYRADGVQLTKEL